MHPLHSHSSHVFNVPAPGPTFAHEPPEVEGCGPARPAMELAGPPDAPGMGAIWLLLCTLGDCECTCWFLKLCWTSALMHRRIC